MKYLGPVYIYAVHTILTTVLLLLLTSPVSTEVSRRFLFGDFCKVCYDCVCQGKWEECPLGTHEQTTNNCKKYVDKNEDCSKSYQIHGGWTIWTKWGGCHGDCTKSQRRRHRSCTNPSPANCGRDCSGPTEEFKTCHIRSCTTSTTTQKTTTTTKPVPTLISVSSSCNKFCSVASVAQNHTAISTEAEVCGDGSKHGSDALLAQCCKLDISASFTKSANVFLSCQSLPSYIPVARFDGNQVVKGTAGIFVNCLDNGEQGFRMIRQACDRNPEIVHVSLNSTDFGQHTIRYYVIS